MSTTTEPKYGSSVALTTTNLQSLATSSTLLTGWSSGTIDNTSNLSVDERISGLIKLGTSPTLGSAVEVWVWEILDDTPTYPDAITGSEANAIALTSVNVKQSGAFKQAVMMVVDATSSRIFPFTFGLSKIFGLLMPKKYGLWITHNTGANLASSGNVITRLPAQLQEV